MSQYNAKYLPNYPKHIECASGNIKMPNNIYKVHNKIALEHISNNLLTPVMHAVKW